MDSSQARVPMPQPDGGGFLPSLPPFLAPFARAPLLVPVAYRPANGPRVQPIAPPAPPNPRFPPLTAPQQQNFQTWLNSRCAGDVSGGRPAEVASQLRVAGYPEHEVPIAPGTGKGTTLMVDGFRDSDGMAVEAKRSATGRSKSSVPTTGRERRSSSSTPTGTSCRSTPPH
nr:restriction endonuclease fold toxin-2 domain-containing protein [Streptomyces sp. NRRL S-241]